MRPVASASGGQARHAAEPICQRLSRNAQFTRHRRDRHPVFLHGEKLCSQTPFGNGDPRSLCNPAVFGGLSTPHAELLIFAQLGALLTNGTEAAGFFSGLDLGRYLREPEFRISLAGVLQDASLMPGVFHSLGAVHVPGFPGRFLRARSLADISILTRHPWRSQILVSGQTERPSPPQQGTALRCFPREAV